MVEVRGTYSDNQSRKRKGTRSVEESLSIPEYHLSPGSSLKIETTTSVGYETGVERIGITSDNDGKGLERVVKVRGLVSKTYGTKTTDRGRWNNPNR